LSLEREIESQISEQAQAEKEKAEPQYDYGLESVLPISEIINSIFLFLSKDWEEEDRKKLLLDDMESRNLNEMLTPYVFKLAMKLGLAITEISALVALGGLFLPRIFTYVTLSSKYSKKRKTEVKKEEPKENVLSG